MAERSSSSDDCEAAARRPLLEPELSERQRPSSFPFVLLGSCATACLGAFSFGYTVGFTSPALGPMTKELHLSTGAAALFSSLVALGAMPGSLAAGPFTQNYGPRAALVLSATLLALHWALIASCKVLWALLLARFLGGVGVGIASLSVPLYVTEVASEEWRGQLGAWNQLFITIGTLAVYSLGLLLPPPDWPRLAAAGCVPALLLLALVPLIPESPRWLARHRAVPAVAQSLRRLRGQGSWAKGPAEEAGEGEQQEFDAIMAAARKEASMRAPGSLGHGRSQLHQLLDPANRTPFLVAVGLMVLQQLSGINAVVFFAASIFSSAGFSNPNLPTCFVGLVQVLITLCSSLLIDRLGRRPLLLLSAAGMATFALGLGLTLFVHSMGPGGGRVTVLASFLVGHRSSGIVTAAASASSWGAWYGVAAGLCCTAYVVAYALGVGPIPWLLMAEILPPAIKGVGSSLVVLTNWMLCFLITQTFPALNAWSPAGTFWIYSGVCTLGVAFIRQAVPETRGRSLEEIAAFFAADG